MIELFDGRIKGDAYTILWRTTVFFWSETVEEYWTGGKQDAGTDVLDVGCCASEGNRWFVAGRWLRLFFLQQRIYLHQSSTFLLGVYSGCSPVFQGRGFFFAHYSAGTTDALLVGTTTTMFTHVALFSRPISCRIFVWQKQSCSLIVSLVTTSNQQAARAAIGGWGEIQHTCSVELLFVQQLFIGWKNEQLLPYQPGWNKAGKDAVTNTRGGQSTRLRLTLTFLF